MATAAALGADKKSRFAEGGADAAVAASSFLPTQKKLPQCKSSCYWPLAEALTEPQPRRQQQQAGHAAAHGEEQQLQRGGTHAGKAGGQQQLQQQLWQAAGGEGGQVLAPTRAAREVFDRKPQPQQQGGAPIPNSSRQRQQPAAIRNNLAQQLHWFQQLEELQLKLQEQSFKREVEEQQTCGEQDRHPGQEKRENQEQLVGLQRRQGRAEQQQHTPESETRQQQQRQLYGLPLCVCGALLGPTDNGRVALRGDSAAPSHAAGAPAATNTPPLSLQAFSKLRRQRLQGWGRPPAPPMGAAGAHVKQQQRQQRDVLTELLQGVRARAADRRRQQRERHEQLQKLAKQQQEQAQQVQQRRGSRSYDNDAGPHHSSGGSGSFSNSGVNVSETYSNSYSGGSGGSASSGYSSSDAYQSSSRSWGSSRGSFHSSSNPYSSSSSGNSYGSSSSSFSGAATTSSSWRRESPLRGMIHEEDGQTAAAAAGDRGRLPSDSGDSSTVVGQQQLQNGRDARLRREIAAACPVDFHFIAACNRRIFGNSTFRPMQREVIEAVLCKRDVFVVLATGGGKSLCYQLPAVLSPGLTVVVVPLLSLMMDQLEQLQLLNIGCKALVASQSWEAQRALYDDIRREAAAAEEDEATAAAAAAGGSQEQRLKLLLATPEKLQSSRALRQLLHELYTQQQLCRFVIDEAHCVSQWGNDFRPDYCHLCSLRRDFPAVPLLALTATATQQVVQDVARQLDMREPLLFQGSFDRPNLRYEVRPKNARRVVTDIATLIKEDFENMSGIVYCLSKKECERVAEGLQQQGISAAFYHAQLEPQRREEVQRDWMNDDTRVVVATLAFGMGINKRDVRFVVHCAMPKSLENFYQEAGRAGRDGQEATCVLFYEYHDKQRQAHLIQSSSAEGYTSAQQRQRNETSLLRMLAYCEEEVLCRRQFLLQHFGEEFKGECRIACDNCSKRSRSDFPGALQTIPCGYEAQQVVEFVRECRQRCAGVSLTISSLRDFLLGKRGSSRSRSSRGSSGTDVGSLRLFGVLGHRHWGPQVVFKLLKQLVIHQVLRERCVSTGAGNSTGFSSIVAYVELGCREKDAAKLVSTISLFSSSSSPSSGNSGSPGCLPYAAYSSGETGGGGVDFARATPAAAAAAKRKTAGSSATAALRRNGSSSSSTNDLDDESGSNSSSSDITGGGSLYSCNGGSSSNSYKRNKVSTDRAEVWGRGSKRQRSSDIARLWSEQQQQRKLLSEDDGARDEGREEGRGEEDGAAAEGTRQQQVLRRQAGCAAAAASVAAAATRSSSRSEEGHASAEGEDSGSSVAQLRLSEPLQKMLQAKLKSLRQQLAEAHAIKNASSIASQHTLTQLSLHLPVNAQQLAALESVRDLKGEYKMKKYGLAFVEAVRFFLLEQDPLLLARLEKRRAEQQGNSSPADVGSSRKPCSSSTAAFTQRLLQRQTGQHQQARVGTTSLFLVAPAVPYCNGEASTFLTLGGRSAGSPAAFPATSAAAAAGNAPL